MGAISFAKSTGAAEAARARSTRAAVNAKSGRRISRKGLRDIAQAGKITSASTLRNNLHVCVFGGVDKGESRSNAAAPCRRAADSNTNQPDHEIDLHPTRLRPCAGHPLHDRA